MPEMRFVVRWPDGRRESCYSPSLVIRDYFTEGETYELGAFLELSRTALNLASERVRAKYGFPCSLALGQLSRMETAATAYSPQARVTVEEFLTGG